MTDDRHLFAATSLLDYLQADRRPTFVVDLSVVDWTVAFSNNAFRATASKVAWATDRLRSWVLDCIETPANFHGTLWSGSTVDARWRVVSGTVLTGTATGQADAAMQCLHSLFPEGYTESLPARSSEHISLVADFDWGCSRLGRIQDWSPGLRQIVRFSLCCPTPGALFWGPERTVIYNDAFVDLIPDLHPHSLGHSVKVEWEFWPHYEPMCREVEATRRAASRIAAEGPLLAHQGILRETFFTFDYTPIFDNDGQVAGIYGQATEVTGQVISPPRTLILLRLSEIVARVTTRTELWTAATTIFQDCLRDLPLVSVYSTVDDVYSAATDPADRRNVLSQTWNLVTSLGCPAGHSMTTETLTMGDQHGLGPAIREATGVSTPTILHLNGDLLPSALLEPCAYKGFPYTSIVVCPLRVSSGAVVACLIFAINPFRPYDHEFQHFVQVMARQIEDALKLVGHIEAQRKVLQQTVDQAAREQRLLSAQLERQSRESQEHALRFLRFAEQAPVGVYVLGKDGEIRYANQAWRSLIGLPPETASPEDDLLAWRRAVHPDDLVEVDRQWQLLVDGKTQERFEWRAIRQPPTGDPEKDVVYLRSSCFPELAEDGSMRTVTGLLMDCSLEFAQERISHAKMEQALEEKRAQEYFMDMVSHEMRNPLNAMIQCAEEVAELLADLKLSQESPEATLNDCTAATDTILYCGRHQKQIIDDVLTLSKLDSNLLTISPFPACPSDMLKQALRMFDSEIRAADVQLVVDLASTELLQESEATVLIDSGRTLQVLINLIGNAIKFTKGMPIRKLLVSLDASLSHRPTEGIRYIPSSRVHDDSGWFEGEAVYLYFSISDTGPGLTIAEMEALFARFKQASPRTHAQYGGSGLGLFISRELTELQGGEIGVSSEVGRGSTFAFYIKGRRAAGSVKSMPSSPAIPTRSVSKKEPSSSRPLSAPMLSLKPVPSLDGLGVLIVEDNIINQQVLKRQLEKVSCRVLTANNGQEALEVLEQSTWWRGKTAAQHQSQIHVILCDLEMPVMDGKTCVRRIREWQHEGVLAGDIPVIAVTGNARVPLREAQNWGFDNVMPKPFSVKTLLPMLQKCR